MKEPEIEIVKLTDDLLYTSVPCEDALNNGFCNPHQGYCTECEEDCNGID